MRHIGNRAVVRSSPRFKGSTATAKVTFSGVTQMDPVFVVYGRRSLISSAAPVLVPFAMSVRPIRNRTFEDLGST